MLAKFEIFAPSNHRTAPSYTLAFLGCLKAARNQCRGTIVTLARLSLREVCHDAWQDFSVLPNLTPDEKASGPSRLRWYIRLMVEVGERDPAKIAKAAMGMLREYEQILRSQARVENVTHAAESTHSQ